MLTLIMLRLRSSWLPALFHIVIAGAMILLPWRATELPGFSGWLSPFLVFIYTPGLLQSLSNRDQKDFGNPSLALALPVSRTGYLAYRLLVPLIILSLTVLFTLFLGLVLPHLLPPKESAIFVLVPDHLGFVLSWWLVVLGTCLLLEAFCAPAFRMIAYVLLSMLPLFGMFSPLGAWLVGWWQQVPLVDIPWFPDPGCLGFAGVTTAIVFGIKGRNGPPGRGGKHILGNA